MCARGQVRVQTQSHTIARTSIWQIYPNLCIADLAKMTGHILPAPMRGCYSTLGLSRALNLLLREWKILQARYSPCHSTWSNHEAAYFCMHNEKGEAEHTFHTCGRCAVDDDLQHLCRTDLTLTYMRRAHWSKNWGWSMSNEATRLGISMPKQTAVSDLLRSVCCHTLACR